MIENRQKKKKIDVSKRPDDGKYCKREILSGEADCIEKRQRIKNVLNAFCVGC